MDEKNPELYGVVNGCCFGLRKRKWPCSTWLQETQQSQGGMDHACLASISSWDVISIPIFNMKTALACSLPPVLSLYPAVKKSRQLSNVSVTCYHKITEITEREACTQKALEESSQPGNEAAGGTNQGRGQRGPVSFFFQGQEGQVQLRSFTVSSNLKSKL